MTEENDKPEALESKTVDDPAERAALASQILERMRRLLAGGFAEREALAVAEKLLEWLTPPTPPDGSIRRIRQMAALADDRKRDRRRLCVRLITEAAGKGWAPEFLGRALAEQDEDLAWLADAPDVLAQKLANWSATRAAGKATSEKIMAELIVESLGALGLAARDDENKTDAIERIRGFLVRDVAERKQPKLLP